MVSSKLDEMDLCVRLPRWRPRLQNHLDSRSRHAGLGDLHDIGLPNILPKVKVIPLCTPNPGVRGVAKKQPALLEMHGLANSPPFLARLFRRARLDVVIVTPALRPLRRGRWRLWQWEGNVPDLVLRQRRILALADCLPFRACGAHVSLGDLAARPTQVGAPLPALVPKVFVISFATWKVPPLVASPVATRVFCISQSDGRAFFQSSMTFSTQRSVSPATW